MRTGCRIALALLLVSVLLVSILPVNTSAIPYKIEGYLRDSNNVAIPLANISISGRYYNDSAQGFQTAVSYTTTNTDGYYRIYVAASEPGGYETGSEMTVSYSSDGTTVSKVIVIQGLGSWANLTYNEKPGLIDAITSPIGLLVLIMIATVIIVVVYIFYSREEEITPENEESTPKRVKTRRRQR